MNDPNLKDCVLKVKNYWQSNKQQMEIHEIMYNTTIVVSFAASLQQVVSRFKL